MIYQQGIIFRWVNIALKCIKTVHLSNFLTHQPGVAQMYDLAYCNPRMSGNVYRGTRKCGNKNCKCSKSSKHKHPFWRLEYRVREKGRWTRKREYVPKSRVKSLRQRIKRAKQRDRQRREQLAFFMQKSSDFLKGEIAVIIALSKQKVKPITLRQKTQILNIYIQLITHLEGAK